MHNPAHPGMLIEDQMGGRTITDVAKHLRITRAALSRIINGKAAISAEMALRLEDVFGIKADMWLRLQAQRDLWVALQKKRVKLEPLQYTEAA